jgi:hypothetical protein
MSGLSNFLGNVYGEDDEPDRGVSIPAADQRATSSLDDIRDSMKALLAQTEPTLQPQTPALPESPVQSKTPEPADGPGGTTDQPLTWVETLDSAPIEPIEPSAMISSEPEIIQTVDDDWFSSIDDSMVRTSEPEGTEPRHFLDGVNEAESTDWFGDIRETEPALANSLQDEQMPPVFGIEVPTDAAAQGADAWSSDVDDQPAGSFAAAPTAPAELLSADDFEPIAVTPEEPESWIDEILGEELTPVETETEQPFDVVYESPGSNEPPSFAAPEPTLAPPVYDRTLDDNLFGDETNTNSTLEHLPLPAPPHPLDAPEHLAPATPARSAWTARSDDIIPGKLMTTTSYDVQHFDVDALALLGEPRELPNRRRPRRGRRTSDDATNLEAAAEASPRRHRRKGRTVDLDAVADGPVTGYPAPASPTNGEPSAPDLPAFDGFEPTTDIAAVDGLAADGTAVDSPDFAPPEIELDQFAPPATHELPIDITPPSATEEELPDFPAPRSDQAVAFEPPTAFDPNAFPAPTAAAEFDPPTGAPAAIESLDFPAPQSLAESMDLTTFAPPASDLPEFAPLAFDAAPFAAFPAPEPGAEMQEQPPAPMSAMALGLETHGSVLDQGPNELDPALQEKPKRRGLRRRR